MDIMKYMQQETSQSSPSMSLDSDLNSMRRVIDARFPKRRARAICSIPEEEEFDDDELVLTAPAAVTESHSSPPSVMADIMQVSASDMRECLEGALMAILPREERIKRAAAAATSPVEWSHVRMVFSAGPPGKASISKVSLDVRDLGIIMDLRLSIRLLLLTFWFLGIMNSSVHHSRIQTSECL